MKSVRQTLLERRSIRRYEYDQVTPRQMQFIREAVRNTPTSYNGQQFSVIEIDDQPLKEELYALIGQKQIKTCSRFLLFCIDYHKISLLAAEKGVEMPPFTDTADGLTVGIVDAAMAMMSALTAACSLGLGCCCIGYARTAHPIALAKTLGLPKGVFVVCGLSIGVPREMPDLKPKQPLATVFHRNHYSADTELLPALAEYDAEITRYNATRAGTKTTHDWCTHIVDYYREAMGYHLLNALREQGFDIKD